MIFLGQDRHSPFVRLELRRSRSRNVRVFSFSKIGLGNGDSENEDYGAGSKDVSGGRGVSVLFVCVRDLCEG